MSKTVFITGANGFIGRSVVRQLAKVPGLTLKALVRRPLVDAPGVEEVLGDLLEPATYAEAFRGVDVVVHLAAATGAMSAADHERINAGGTRALAQAAKAAGVGRFLHISTIAAGYPNQRYYPYAKSKARAEAAVRDSGLAYAILRPTIVLGRDAPIWLTLSKIAKLPIIPLPQGGKAVMAQPVEVEDVARGVALIVESDRFDGETLDLGGPSPQPFGAFLADIHEAQAGERPAIVPFPLAPIRLMLATIERILPRFPITAGQFAVFANDSAAAPNWLMDALTPAMPSTRDTLASLVGPAPTPGGGPSPGATAPRALSALERAKLDAESETFARALIGAPVSAYVRDHYARACSVHGLADDAAFGAFDRATLDLARRSAPAARWADAYCALLHRRGALRRKLIVLSAILEHVAPTDRAFDDLKPRGPVSAFLKLAGQGFVFAGSLLMGLAFLTSARLGRRARPA